MKCSICGSEKTSLLTDLGECTFNHCLKCGVDFTDPMKAGDDAYYEAFYGAEAPEYGDEKKWEFEEFLKDADKLGLKGNLLDVGCGSGFFLKLAKSRGFNVFGIDFNGEAIHYAVEKLGLNNVAVGEIFDIPKFFPDIKFDAVVMFHVLEHLEDPNKVIAYLKTLLAMNGVIVVALPNRERTTLKFNFRKKREGWDYPPHHLTRWDKKSLTSFFKQNGFNPVVVKEERIKLPRQVFSFIKGVLQLLTSTNIMVRENQKIAGGLSVKKSFSLRRFVLNILSLAKRAFVNLVAIVLFAPVFIGAQVFYMKGTNLYVIAEEA